MISARHVLTAAHCVWDSTRASNEVGGLEFSPALHGGKPPFGTVGYQTVRLPPRFFQLTGNTAEQYDFAVVTLATPVGKETGWLGLHWTNDNIDLNTTITGYPTDKAPGTMWTDNCSLAIDGGNTTTNLVPTSCDAGSGEAGAPMYGPNNNIRAMLVGGNQGIENWAVKINQFVFSALLEFMQADGEFQGLTAANSGPVMMLPATPPSSATQAAHDSGI